MSYGADFAPADPAGAPLDPTRMIGADPMMWAAGVLLLLAALLLGWFLGARTRSSQGDATASIWKDIDRAAKDAMKADDNALKGRAQHLLDVIDRRLGRTLALVAGPGGSGEGVEGLRVAVAGRRQREHPGHDHGRDDQGRGRDGHDAGHGPSDDSHAGGPAPTAAASTGSVTIVNVIPGSPIHGERLKPHDPHPPRDLTAREQTAALRLAVAAFNEHWRHESARTKAMRAALGELSSHGGRAGPNLSRG